MFASFLKHISHYCYNLRHNTLGHPVQKPYSDKALCSFPPSVEFFVFCDANSNKPTLGGQKTASQLSQLM